MKRLSNDRNDAVSAAILAYKRLVIDSGLLDDLLDGDEYEISEEDDFAIGFFVGAGLSKQEALEAASHVTSNGW